MIRNFINKFWIKIKSLFGYEAVDIEAIKTYQKSDLEYYRNLCSYILTLQTKFEDFDDVVAELGETVVFKFGKKKMNYVTHEEINLDYIRGAKDAYRTVMDLIEENKILSKNDILIMIERQFHIEENN